MAVSDRYLIERELGAGGMATVYLAEDLRHHRQVAVKVLRPELAAVIGAERFLAEIRTTANLQHPHILPLFDSGEADGFLFYVMPLIQGESLRERITREKQLPVPDAVRIATEVAGALDYAHRHNVIHRDIKPENILLHDGRALVADFGIALAASKGGGSRMTETGMSLGTPHYMSPEQAMGEREITARSDVYALGAITYEMLVGEPPFTGPTAQAIIARVMTEEPRSLSNQRKSIPPGVEAAVFTALEKIPGDRYATAAEFAAALADSGTISRRTVPIAAVHRTRRVNWLVTGGLVAAALAAGLLLGRRGAVAGEGAGQTVRAALDLGDSSVVLPIGNARLAISPSGDRVVYVGASGSDGLLSVRILSEPASQQLSDTKGGFAPFFSPDGRSIGFFAPENGRTVIKVVPATGGVARTILTDSVAAYGGGDWGDDGNIYFANIDRGLSRVAATGGSVTRVAVRDSSRGIEEVDFADVLPGSRQAFVMLWQGSPSSNRVGVVDLRSGMITPLAAGSYARYMAPGSIAIGAADGSLLVAPFDAKHSRLSAEPLLVLRDVQGEISNGTMQYAVADNGTLVYQRRHAGNVTVLWVDRGGAFRAVDSTLKGQFSSVSLSPDATQLALAQGVPGGSEIWVKQLATGGFSRISGELDNADRPVWMPDGKQVGFLATRAGRRTAWVARSDGSDSARAIDPALGLYDEVWFDRAGRYTLFRSEGTLSGSRHLLVLEHGVDTTPRPLLRSRYDNYAMTLSPDGRWMAYASIESGSREVYVRPFPSVDSAKFAISTGGGLEPVWRRDGRELFFRSTRGEMYAVTVTPGPRFVHGSPHLLFARPEMALQDFYRSYDVHPDGTRFLMLSSGIGDANALNVIINWRPYVANAAP